MERGSLPFQTSPCPEAGCSGAPFAPGAPEIATITNRSCGRTAQDRMGVRAGRSSSRGRQVAGGGYRDGVERRGSSRSLLHCTTQVAPVFVHRVWQIAHERCRRAADGGDGTYCRHSEHSEESPREAQACSEPPCDGGSQRARGRSQAPDSEPWNHPRLGCNKGYRGSKSSASSPRASSSSTCLATSQP